MSLLAELKRRNVFNVTAAYLVVGWLLTEVLTELLETLGAPDWAARGVILAFAFGFIPTVVLSWIYQMTPEGIKRDSDIRDNADMRAGSRTFDYLAIASVVVLTIVLAFLGSQSPLSERGENTTAVSNASVAVLPRQSSMRGHLWLRPLPQPQQRPRPHLLHRVWSSQLQSRHHCLLLYPSA